MICESIVEAVGDTPIVRLSRLFGGSGIEVFAKLEYLNPIGSSKDRVARYVIEQSVERGLVKRGGRIVESSSGNFGIALAAMAPLYGISVTCVVDPNICASNHVILRNLGADIEMVGEPDSDGGYLGARLRRVQEIVSADPQVLRVNQYANELCAEVHTITTAAEILRQVDAPMDLLAVAVSTTATLAGISRGLKASWPHLKLVAVDSVGSVVFGGQPGVRRLPGLGSSRRSEFMQASDVDDVIYVSEPDAIDACRDLLRSEGILAGASSGALVSALRGLAPALAAGTRAMIVLPDRGERYLDSVYGASPIEDRDVVPQARRARGHRAY